MAYQSSRIPCKGTVTSSTSGGTGKVSGWVRPESGMFPLLGITGKKTISVPAGTGYIVDAKGTPAKVSWDNQELSIQTNTGWESLIAINANGQAVQITDMFDPAVTRKHIVLGTAYHIDGFLRSVDTTPDVWEEEHYVFQDMAFMYSGEVLQGGELSASGSTPYGLTIGAEKVFQPGANVNGESPNYISNPEQDNINFYTCAWDGSVEGPTRRVPLDKFSPTGSSSYATVPVGKATVHRLYQVGKLYILLLGQYTYDSSSSAVAAASSEVLTLPTQLSTAKFVGYIIEASGASNLDSATITGGGSSGLGGSIDEGKFLRSEQTSLTLVESPSTTGTTKLVATATDNSVSLDAGNTKELSLLGESVKTVEPAKLIVGSTDLASYVKSLTGSGSSGKVELVPGTGFTPGTTTQIQLQHPYETKSQFIIYFNGVLQAESTYTYDPATKLVTFSNPIPIGTTSLTVLPVANSGGSKEDFNGGTHFTPGVSTTLVLQTPYKDKSEFAIYFDGVLQASAGYTYQPSGSIVTFASPIPVTVSRINVVPLAGSSTVQNINITTQLLVEGVPGETGQVLISQGKDKPPKWAWVDAVPIGAIVAYAAEAIPVGWLLCAGQEVSRTQYADLFAYIGTTYGAGDGSRTFKLPDLRGEFIRGLDSGRGVDPNRSIGSTQSSQNLSHTHTISTSGSTAFLELGSREHPFDANTASGWGVGRSGLTAAANGGSEARPRNVALPYCIKYQASVPGDSSGTGSGGGSSGPVGIGVEEFSAGGVSLTKEHVSKYLRISSDGNPFTLSASTEFSKGDVISGVSTNADHPVEIVPVTGVTLNVADGFASKTRGLYSAFSLICVDANMWDMVGDLASQ